MSGECGCVEAFILIDKDFYKAQFLDVLRWLIRLETPNIPDISPRGVSTVNIGCPVMNEEGEYVGVNLPYANGMIIEPLQWQMWNVFRQDSEDSQIMQLNNQPADGRSQESERDTNCSPTRILHLRVSANLDALNSSGTLCIVGTHLDWECLLEDIELNRIDLSWHFYYSHSEEETSEEYFSDDELMEMDDGSDENSHPAALWVVQNLTTVDVEALDMRCCVCQERIALGSKAKQLPCEHLYHEECITRWLSVRNTCPVCRYEFPTQDLNH
ncbi:hypothetical protein SUGI_0769300 [Cryptomeria japonica]|nr:hypothetical protein SUGI_0769300 [Cryptomeria japonica]